MSTAATKKAPAAILVTPALAKRILDEGYGPGAWHGNDMKAALADVTPKLAYWRPAPGRTTSPRSPFITRFTSTVSAGG